MELKKEVIALRANPEIYNRTSHVALPRPPRVRRQAVERTASEVGLTLRENSRSDRSSWGLSTMETKFHRWELVGLGVKRKIFLTLEDVDLYLTNLFHI